LFFYGSGYYDNLFIVDVDNLLKTFDFDGSLRYRLSLPNIKWFPDMESFIFAPDKILIGKVPTYLYKPLTETNKDEENFFIRNEDIFRQEIVFRSGGSYHWRYSARTLKVISYFFLEMNDKYFWLLKE
jgi:hypothetical protein